MLYEKCLEAFRLDNVKKVYKKETKNDECSNINLPYYKQEANELRAWNDLELQHVRRRAKSNYIVVFL